MLVNTIRDLCRTHRVTFSQVEQECGMGKGTISKWKESSPTVDNVRKVAKYFDVPIAWLLMPKDNATSGHLSVTVDGDAACGCTFHSMRKLLSLIEIFAKGQDVQITIHKRKATGDGADGISQSAIQ